jgi:glycerol-3-phosphate dehydrogenase
MTTLRVHKSKPIETDCLVLGGGITGAGVARDAAMRGLSTMLIDSHDFASGTSHVTSKLIHGGLRYLEHAQFRLVWEGLVERDRLLNRIAPNLVSPLRFVIPYESHQFARWLCTIIGVQAYGLIERRRGGRRSLVMSASLLARLYPKLIPHRFGVCFWDAQANDARMVVSTLRTAEAAGATVHNYTHVESAEFDGDHWRMSLSSDNERDTIHVRTRVLVNATGPWSPKTAKILRTSAMDLMWVKGTHILVNRDPAFGNDAIIIRSIRDGRSLWAIPWNTKIIVGTTESHFDGDLRDIRPSKWEIADLFESFRHFFPGLETTTADITGAYAGVRPIVIQDGESENELSRKHEVAADTQQNLITITGGKLTTFRAMAEKSVDKIVELLGRSEVPTGLRQRLRTQPLWPAISKEEGERTRGELLRQLNGRRVADDVLDHWIRLYGPEATSMAAKVVQDASLGRRLFDGLPYSPAELLYLCETEWVSHLLDLVKRRTSMYFLAGRQTLAAIEEILPLIAKTMEWDERQADEELGSIRAEFDADSNAIRDYASKLDGTNVAACA